MHDLIMSGIISVKLLNLNVALQFHALLIVMI